MGKKNDGIKSSYELAMERLEKSQGKVRSLTDEQKDLIAQIDARMKSKLAELEIMWEQRLTEAYQTGDPAKVKEVEAERVRQIEKIRSEAEADKDAVREG